MALSWGFGAPLHTGGRLLYSEFLISEVQKILKNPSEGPNFGDELVKRMILEESGDFFTYYYDCEREFWVRWDYEIDKYNILGN